MLEPPPIEEAEISRRLQDAYGLHIVEIAFLPLGADPNTAVYRAVADDTRPYFVKLRQGVFDETSVALPRYLSDQGIAQIIPPLAATTGQLWARLGAFTVIVYPFVEGRNGYEVAMSEQYWHDFGTALKRIHTVAMPPALIERIQPETYPAHGRDTVRAFLAQLDDIAPVDAVATRLAAFLKQQRAATLDLVERADRLAGILQARTPEFTVCHSDVHAANILIDANDRLYIVDWDNPIRAPKERDLMFIGGGQGFLGHTAEKEQRLFYRGYGQTQIDQVALAYYRYERIVQDIAVYCEQLFLTAEGGDDREPSLRFLMSNYLPGGTIEVAYTSDKTELWHNDTPPG